MSRAVLLLALVAGAAGAVSAQVTTGSLQGFYRFTNLLPGLYLGREPDRLRDFLT